NSSGSDFTDSSKYFYYLYNGIEEKIVRDIKSLKRKKIIVFCNDIKSAERLSKRIKGSKIVHSKQKTEERDKNVKDFTFGEARIIINVSVIGVGYDNPDVDCIIMGNSTNSIS